LEANFSGTTLEKTDFRRARNFNINPEFNRLKGAKFNNAQLAGLLTKFNLDIDF